MKLPRLFKFLRLFRYGYAVPPALVLTLIPFAGAKDNSKAPGIVRRNCSGCHGMDGNSQLPYFPRLSGLTAEYGERKLLNFRNSPAPSSDDTFSRIAHLRHPQKDPGITAQATEYMVGVSHAISDEDARSSAIWYASQEPAPGRGGDRKLIEQGKELFMNGYKPARLIACQTCHGKDALGSPVAPRLASQNAVYMVGQLGLFRAGDRHHSPEMTSVAQNIEGDQARAVAAYLQSQ